METSSLTFAEPLWFLALLLVPILGALYFWSQKRSDALISKLVAPRLKAQLAGAVSRGVRLFKAILVLAALALIAVTLARPQVGFVEHEIKQRGRDILIAVDTSRSMLATDVTPTRLARAKLVAQDLMRLVRGDRIGLIAFAGSSFLQAPLTLDYNAVLTSLEELDTTIIPKGGTNIAAAIREAEEAFGKGEGQTRALIIFTDGEELDTDGITAAKKAAEKGIRIFTVGIGSGEGSLIPIRAEGGGTDFVRDAAGKPVQSRLDEARLKEIASAGGGFYQPLGPDAAREIFEKGIVPMELGESGQMTSRQPIERYQWPLGAAVALLVLWMLLGDRRRPARIARPAVAALLLLASVAGVQAVTGVEEYESGNYDKAMADFSQQLKSDPESVKLQYNTGAAAYKLGDYGKAVDHFTKALLSEDKKLREEASYNLGNSLVRRGEAAKGNDEKKADWKNAIQHYTEALNLEPKNKQAEDNRDIVKKLLEDLEKKEEEQKKQDQKDNQQKNQQDQKDKKDQKDQKKDQQQNKDQQNKDQKDQQDQQKNDQQKQDQKDQSKDQKDNKDQQGQGGDQDKKDQQGQQDKKDQADNKDQKQNGQQGQDKEKKDENNKDDKNESGQPNKQDQKDQKGDQKQDQANQGQKDEKQPSGSPQDKQDQPQPAPQPTPGDKKEGDLKSAGGEEEKKDQPQGQGAAAGEAGAEEKEGEMSAAQARSLLNSLRSDERRVKLMQQPQTEDTLKDW